MSLEFKIEKNDLPKTISHKEYVVLSGFENKNENIKEAIKRFNKKINEGSEYIENELVKTDLDVKVIIKFVKEINRMKKEYGVTLPNIDFEYVHKIMHKIHFLKEKNNKKNGEYNNSRERIKIFDFKKDDYLSNKNNEEKLFKIINNYRVLIHELIHLNSYISEQIDFTNGILYSSSTGYAKVKEVNDFKNGKKIIISKFSSFNEGVTEMITLELMNSDYIKKFLKKEIRGGYFYKSIELESYFNERKEIKDLIVKIAERNNVCKDDIWDEIKRAYFTGDNEGVLKKIKESYYGTV